MEKRAPQSRQMNIQLGKHLFSLFLFLLATANSSNLSVMTSGSESTSNKAVKIHQAAHLSDCIVEISVCFVRIGHNRITIANGMIVWIEAELRKHSEKKITWNLMRKALKLYRKTINRCFFRSLNNIIHYQKMEYSRGEKRKIQHQKIVYERWCFARSPFLWNKPTNKFARVCVCMKQFIQLLILFFPISIISFWFFFVCFFVLFICLFASKIEWHHSAKPCHTLPFNFNPIQSILWQWRFSE